MYVCVGMYVLYICIYVHMYIRSVLMITDLVGH